MTRMYTDIKLLLIGLVVTSLIMTICVNYNLLDIESRSSIHNSDSTIESSKTLAVAVTTTSDPYHSGRKIYQTREEYFRIQEMEKLLGEMNLNFMNDQHTNLVAQPAAPPQKVIQPMKPATTNNNNNTNNNKSNNNKSNTKKTTTKTNTNINDKHGGDKEDTRSRIIAQKLKEKGMESVRLHDFKSIYIRDLKIYNRQLTPKAAGKRTLKIISSLNSPHWFTSIRSTSSFHRDFKMCPYRECFFDISGKMQEKAALVMVFPKPWYKKNNILPTRPPGQIWAHCNWEPPPYYAFGRRIDYDVWKGVFNWTVGYSQVNDFFFPTNLLTWRAKETLLSDAEYLNFAKRKTKTAVWWASHCNATSNRDAYVREMQKYIDIDIYGKCGNLTCTVRKMCTPMLNDTYKFYLAFENSFCTDYVTPKFFRNFERRTFVVPVVRGGFDYEKHFPSNTYINTKNYKSPKDLALYLKYLANDNIEKYASYLKEKDKLMALNYKNDWCEICEMLHTNVKHKTIPDVHKLIHPKGVCWNVTDVF